MNRLKQAGFTLIELIMVVVLLGIIGVVVSQLYAHTLFAALTAQNTTNALSQGQLGIERMARDIRQVRSASSITANTSTQFSFVDVTGATNTYSLSGTTLMLNGIALANGISSLSFSYFDLNGLSVPAGSTNNLAYVTVSLHVTQSNSNYHLTTSLYLRDLSS